MVEKKATTKKTTKKKVANKPVKTGPVVKQAPTSSLLSMMLNEDIGEVTIIDMMTLMKEHLHQQHQNALELTKVVLEYEKETKRSSDDIFDIYYRAIDAVMENSLAEVLTNTSGEQQ